MTVLITKHADFDITLNYSRNFNSTLNWDKVREPSFSLGKKPVEVYNTNMCNPFEGVWKLNLITSIAVSYMYIHTLASSAILY